MEKDVSKSKIPKSEKEVKGSAALAEWIQKKGEASPRKKDWWIRIPKKWWFNDMEKLNPSERCVLITLKLYANVENLAYPSLRTMARNLSCSVNTIRAGVKGLEKKGYIEIVKTRGRFNSYKLKISSVIG